MAVAPDPIQSVNADARAIIESLDAARQTSLRSAADDIFRRAIVLAIGSYFELRLSRAIEEFCANRSNKDAKLCEFIRNKALLRQYHTLFDWTANNANKFLKLFGEPFKEKVIESAKQDPALAEGIRKFMQLGALRNAIAHGNFAEVRLDQSREDIVRDYEDATRFVAAFEKALYTV